MRKCLTVVLNLCFSCYVWTWVHFFKMNLYWLFCELFIFYWVQLLFIDLYELLIEKNRWVFFFLWIDLQIFSPACYFSVFFFYGFLVFYPCFREAPSSEWGVSISDVLRSPQVLGVSIKVETSRERSCCWRGRTQTIRIDTGAPQEDGRTWEGEEQKRCCDGGEWSKVGG